MVTMKININIERENNENGERRSVKSNNGVMCNVGNVKIMKINQ